MVHISQVKPRATDLHAQLATRNIQQEARDKEMTVTAYLETIDPSDAEEKREGVDAFTRLVMVEGIITTSSEEDGYCADRLERFRKTETATALFGEWVARRWRQAQRANRANAQFLSSDYVVNTINRPYVDAPDLRMAMVQPAIPLSEVIAFSTPISSGDYRVLYLTEPSAASIRLVRIAEAAEFPRISISTSPRTISVHKFGRAIEASYELLRRQRIDTIARLIARIAIQNTSDQVAAAIDVMVNGDGNASTAATSYNLTSLDSGATAGTLTLKGYLAFKMKFQDPYHMTTALAREDVALQMNMLNLGSANVPLQGQPQLGSGFLPINQSLRDGVRLGVTADAPASTIVGIDSGFGLEHVTEIGSNISEAERWITRQVEVMTFGENEAFCVYDQRAIKLLNVNA